MDLSLAVLIFIISVFFIVYYVLLKNNNYWKERNVPYIEPLPLFGNYKDSIMQKKHIGTVAQEICMKFPDAPYIGSFFGTEPALLIQDPELIKVVMTKDFLMCNGREISNYSHREMSTTNVAFAGGDYWKVVRTNLTPLFSSSKLKNMFYLIKECADTFEKLLETEGKTNIEQDKRKLLARFTMDCITACAFGIKSETMKSKNVENIFTSMGNEIFKVSPSRGFKVLTRVLWPKIFYGLGLKVFPDEVSNFFSNLLTDIFRSREATKTSKNDFVDLVLTWKKKEYITGDSIDNHRSNDKKTVNIDVTEQLLVSQCVIFFAAGFETTSTTASFLLYELAKNPGVQNKVIEEVDDYFKKNCEIEYECINTMPYIESCIEESLRLYPVGGLLTREVMYDYTLPTGVNLKKGTRIHIPVFHLHYNPDFFPEPEKFRPERFLGEERNNIKPYTFLPFGEGPRICIGMRFAKMPMYAALLKIFKNYRVELADDMPRKITIEPKSVVTQSVDGIRLKFIPRQT